MGGIGVIKRSVARQLGMTLNTRRKMGCAGVCLLALTGPLAGRVVIGNSDGYWGPDVSSAQDFLVWYERWLDHMAPVRDN
ncbi:hypothetical protein [Streptomyces sp. NPDC054834]